MSNPSPILAVSGRVQAVQSRTVPAVLPRDAYRDESGRTVPAVEGREAYDVQDVNVLTDDGGFVTVSIMPQAVQALGGAIPAVGDQLDSYPVRPYVAWRGSSSRRYAAVGLSLAGDVLAARQSRSAGSRVREVASA